VENPHPSARADAVPKTSRAVTQTRYGGPEVLRLLNQPPPAPGPGEVLVRVHAASVNARDWHVMRGEPRLARLMDRTVFARRGPRVPVRGTDLAGIIATVGAGVAGWAPTRSSTTRLPTSPGAAAPGTPSWTWWGTTACVTYGEQSGPGARLVLSGGGNSGEGRVLGP
jgi:hypothetical protein